MKMNFCVRNAKNKWIQLQSGKTENILDFIVNLVEQIVSLT